MNKDLGSLWVAHANRTKKLGVLSSLRMDDQAGSQEFQCVLKMFLM
jgi:hypothetical protein